MCSARAQWNFIQRSTQFSENIDCLRAAKLIFCFQLLNFLNSLGSRQNQDSQEGR